MNAIEQDAKIRRDIFNVFLKTLTSLPNVTVYTAAEDHYAIRIHCVNEFVPDLFLRWNETKRRYRLYIMVADKDHVKEIAGYAIASVKNCLAASMIVMMYQVLHKLRANNRSED